jgi:hypothetical protein
MSTPLNPAQQQVNVPQQPAIPPRKSKARAWITLIVLVGLLGVGGYFVYQNWGTEAEQTKPGECVSITGAKFSPKFEKLGCDSPNVTHVVAKSLGTSGEKCADPYSEFTETLDEKPVAKLCLIENLAEGTCLKDELVQMDASSKRVDCGEKDAIKVVKVVKGQADKALCPAGSQAFVYPDLPTTQCFALAKE